MPCIVTRREPRSTARTLKLESSERLASLGGSYGVCGLGRDLVRS
jgi:hypothetical protein